MGNWKKTPWNCELHTSKTIIWGKHKHKKHKHKNDILNSIIFSALWKWQIQNVVVFIWNLTPFPKVSCKIALSCERKLVNYKGKTKHEAAMSI